MKGIGTVKIAQISFVVRDIEVSKKKWAQILGVDWNLEAIISAWESVPAYTDGLPEDCSDVKVAKCTIGDGISIALFQPGDKPTPWRKYLDKHGDSVFNLEFFVPDRQEAYDVVGGCCEAKKPYYIGFYSDVTYSILHTVGELGVDLNFVGHEDNTAYIEAMRKDPKAFKG
jgi:hypothetical protein